MITYHTGEIFTFTYYDTAAECLPKLINDDLISSQPRENKYCNLYIFTLKMLSQSLSQARTHINTFNNNIVQNVAI